MHFYNSILFKKDILTLCLVISTHFLWATEKLDTTKVYNISEITVTEHFRNSETRSTAPLQILSSKQIEKLNVLQISDAAKFFSGVSIKDYGGIGGLKTISVRSLGAAHTAVSYDGIILSDCQTGQIDIGRFSLDNVEVLSLNNGQNDNIFQPARQFSSASILNIRTNSPKFELKNFYGKASIKTGSFGLINPSINVNQQINKRFSLNIGCEWLNSKGEYPYILNYSYLNNGLNSKEIRKNTDVQNLRIEGTLYAHFSENETAYLKAYYYNSKRGLPGATILYNEAAFTSQRIEDQSFFTQAYYKKEINKLFSIQFNAKYNKAYLHYLDTAVLNNQGFEESYFAQNEYYGSISLLYKTNQNFSFSFSTDGIINDMFAKFENVNLTHDFALPIRYSLLSALSAKYVADKISINSSLLSTNVRETTQKNATSKDQNRLSPYVGISYSPSENNDLRFRFFYKSIFRLPSFNDLYYSRVGNAHLIPETSNQYNIGLTYSKSSIQNHPSLSFTIDAYHNIVNNKIVAMPTKNIFVWSMVNLGKAKINGFDLTAESSFSLWKKLGFTIGTTYTYQVALDITTPNSNTYNHQIPYTPRISGSGKLIVETDWVNIGYTLLWSGARYAGYQNYTENRLPSYTDHSLSASHIFKLNDKLLSINLEMLNLTNENYAIVKWFPMPGRSVRATMALKF